MGVPSMCQFCRFTTGWKPVRRSVKAPVGLPLEVAAVRGLRCDC